MTTKTEVKHTPTPWSITRKTEPNKVGAWVEGPRTDPQFGRELVADCPIESDAAFIVKAVNAHDELVLAVESVLVAIDTNATKGGDLEERINRCNPLTVETLRSALARAAS